MTGVFAVLLIFGGLIFFHELGHFLAARSFSIGVKTFSLGFGPALFSFTRGKTKYQVAAVPLGGFVSLAGETPDADIPAPFTREDSFSLRPAWQRFIVIAAGSVFNLLLAWFLCWGMMFSGGRQELLPSVGTVPQGSPASAFLLPGDTIRTIDGIAVERWNEVAPLIRKSMGRPVTLEVARGKETLRCVITPRRMAQTNLLGEKTENWVIGVTPSGEYRTIELGFFEAAGAGIGKARDMLVFTWDVLKGLLSRTVPADNLGGPIGIAQMIYQQAEEGVMPLLAIAALLSVNLGLLNLLPIPVLDGGHLLFLTLEMGFRRPIPQAVQEKAMMAGICLLLGLMIFATYNDIARILKQFLS